MTMPLREQHKNDATTTLNGAIDSSVTTVTVTTGSVFPATGNFRVMVDSEIMICTARSTNDLTVIRGQDGTSAASHVDTSTISMIYSVEGLTRMFQDNDAMFGYSGSRQRGLLVGDDGATILTSSDFTWQNQGTATVTDEDGTLLLSCPTDSGQNMRILERNAPSTPYTYIGAMSFCCPSMDTDAKPLVGMGFRESSTGKVMLGGFEVESFFDQNLEVFIRRMSDPSTLFTVNDGPRDCQIKGHLLWIKIENDGTNTKWYLSMDGIAWILYFSEGKATYFTTGPDKVFWFAANAVNSATGAVALNARLHHWSKGE